jgi:phosphohistidine phosphatase
MNPRKTLIVVRHGHAVEGQDDYARELSPRGADEVRSTGEVLQARSTRVDHIVTSSAPRAAATAGVLAPFCAYSGSVEQLRSLYLAQPGTILQAVTSTNEAVNTLLLVGHNPGLSSFVELLTGERTGLHTAEMRYIALDVTSWSLVSLT